MKIKTVDWNGTRITLGQELDWDIIHRLKSVHARLEL